MNSNDHKIFDKDYSKYKDSQHKITEEQLENAFIFHLCEKLKYNFNPIIKTSEQLKENFKIRLEELNKLNIPNREFEKIWINLNQGNTLELFRKIKFDFPKIEKDKKTVILKYFDFENVNNNCFEVINQLTTKNKEGKNNRFDVLILINGIPLIHIELKNENVNIRDATRQINYYKEIEAISKFLNLVKIFVISNGIRTYYLANNNNVGINNNINELMIYKWTNQENEEIEKLLKFSDAFLEKNFLLDFINNYFIVKSDENNVTVMRPYQYHAVNEIIKKINNPNLTNQEKSGYVWHATGSGKTITSFKLCELLAEKNKEIDLTIFLIDRNDLNVQTKKAFKDFSSFRESVNIIDATDTRELIEILNDNRSNKKIIITTIQKLNRALDYKNKSKLKNLQNKKVIFIVDEGHRSQIGIMRQNINNYFNNAINIAFTGTPIFDINAKEGKTTENIFGKLIHKYITHDAIKDKNVLPFSFHFTQEMKKPNHQNNYEYQDDFDEDDKNVIVYNQNEILEKVKFIKEYLKKTTDQYKFNAMLATPNIFIAIKYYELFQKEAPELRVKILFSHKSSNDFSAKAEENNQNKQFMLKQIQAHNPTWTIDDADKYKEEIQTQFKDKEKRTIDLLIVVSMLLTGYDSVVTNTLFLDKRLRFHSLIQAVSRVNRIYPSKAGYVVCLQTTRQDVEEAFNLYTTGDINISNPDLWQVITYEELKEKFINSINELILINNFDSIDHLIEQNLNEEQIKKFINIFKNIQSIFNKIKIQIEFTWNDFRDLITERQLNQLNGIYKTHSESKETKKRIWKSGEYNEIVIGEIFEVDLKFFESILKDWNEKYELNENLKNIKYEIENNMVFKNDEQKLIAMKIINLLEKEENQNKKLTKKEIWLKIQDIFNLIIDEKKEILASEWKTNKETLKKLLNKMKIKGKLRIDEATNHLPEYINSFKYDEKLEEINNKLNEIINLESEIQKIKEYYQYL